MLPNGLVPGGCCATKEEGWSGRIIWGMEKLGKRACSVGVSSIKPTDRGESGTFTLEFAGKKGNVIANSPCTPIDNKVASTGGCNSGLERDLTVLKEDIAAIGHFTKSRRARYRQSEE